MSNQRNIILPVEAIYVLVRWPRSQSLKDERWFTECILMNEQSHIDEFGSSAYLVPLIRYGEWLKEQKFLN